MKPLIIVGSGLAGYTVAREFRKLNKITPLLIITADDGGFYSKPMLSNAFAQGKHADQLITQTAAQMAAQLDATIMTGTRVSGIDGAAKTIATSGGAFEYEQLVLAVGAQPIRLAMDGDAAAEVLAVNHIAEYTILRNRIASRAPTGRARIAILGAGLIGCEFADDLSGGGHRVTLVDPNPLPLAALAAPALSLGLHAALTARGVALQLGTTADRIDRRDDALQVTLANGSRFETDIVLSAVGLRPDLRLAQAAQLETARGILVDAYGQSSTSGIYALGDCAEYPVAGDSRRQVLPYIAPLMSAARAIARTLNGTPTAIDMKPAPVIVKTLCYPLALVPPPAHLAANGQWLVTRHGAHTVCRFYGADGRMHGFGVSQQEAGIRQGLLAELGKAFDTLN